MMVCNELMHGTCGDIVPEAVAGVDVMMPATEGGPEKSRGDDGQPLRPGFQPWLRCSLSRWMGARKSFHRSEPRFPRLQNGDHNDFYPIKLQGRRSTCRQHARHAESKMELVVVPAWRPGGVGIIMTTLGLCFN